MLKIIWQLILSLLKSKKIVPVVLEPSMPISEPVSIPVVVETVTPSPMPKPETLKWGTKEEIRHSIRVICDEFEMPVHLKNDMCATIYGESEFNLNVVCLNLNDGTSRSTTYDKMNALKEALRQKGLRATSTDFGLCQWNDYYHGDEISPETSLNDPEKAVRLMAKYWMTGETRRRWWIAYKSGRYKQFLTLTGKPM